MKTKLILVATAAMFLIPAAAQAQWWKKTVAKIKKIKTLGPKTFKALGKLKKFRAKGSSLAIKGTAGPDSVLKTESKGPSSAELKKRIRSRIPSRRRYNRRKVRSRGQGTKRRKRRK